MKERINKQTLPPVEIIDMTDQDKKGKSDIFSPLLLNKIQEKITKCEQIVLLLNRRGYASYMLCRDCGHVLHCPRCDISLTYHKTDQSMKCHYCDYQMACPTVCPTCNSQRIGTHGFGTQKIAELLKEFFPQTPIIRMDNDTTQRKGAHEKLLRKFSSTPGSILLGTQMIAKGLDFEKVTLVGVINADTGLNLPDFRAGEKTFQLLTQVAGRTGRGRHAGEVIIQTYNPEHYVIQLAKEHDYEGFFYYEMQRRLLGQYPPYYFTTMIKVSSKSKANAQEMVYQLKLSLQSLDAYMQGKVIILGPTTSGIEKINDYYRYHLLLKYKDFTVIQDELFALMEETQEMQKKGIFINIDHEPQYFL